MAKGKAAYAFPTQLPSLRIASITRVCGLYRGTPFSRLFNRTYGVSPRERADCQSLSQSLSLFAEPNKTVLVT